ncbi:MAG: peptide MFS transporter [Phycisphaerales bacterium]|nr:MAG: peptide MFS transporter [Phycisphaerales bacterium]
MASARQGTILGHPKGLYVLFFTELWERFSFYGMKTLLVLYMLNCFFWSQEKASSLLGWYAALAYGLPVVGGFIADHYLGAKRAVVLGAILLSAGHILMAVEAMPAFYTALGLIIAGVGLLKPNVSTQVGALYKPGDPRRDGAFTIFYMGINLGALAGPLLCDWLKDNYGYHVGFAAAGVGMILGLIVYVIGQRILVEFRQDIPAEEGQEGGIPTAESQPQHPPHVVRDRIIVLLVVFAFVILFWTAFEQSPNAMLVWADKHTNLRLASTEPPPVTLDELTAKADGEQEGRVPTSANWFRDPKVGSGQTQSFNPFFIIALAPLFAFLWVWLDKRKAQPSTPTKMVLGLVGVALAFGVMWPAAHLENGASSAPLAAVPSPLAVDEEGFVYGRDDDSDAAERVYYGAKRLRYDAASQTLQMSGVLVDLDRFRLLAQTAPEEFVAEVERFAEQTAEERPGDDGVTALLEHAPEGLGPVEIKEVEGRDRKTIVSWDPETKELTAFAEINKRARAEFLAAAAEPAFKRAVDRVYLDSSDFRVSVWWLIGFYLVLTMGELCLSPVGLSLVTKLAPPKHVGLFMGGWFLATAIAEKLAQVFGAYWGKMPPLDYFFIFVVMCGVGALLMALLVRSLKRMMHGVQ